MARRTRHEEHENHERWLVSYADFITLLFAFFVVMYSVSTVNEGKFRVLADSLVATFQDRNKSLEPIQIGQLVRSPVVDTVSLRTTPVPMQIEMPPVDYTDADRPENVDPGGSGDGAGQTPEGADEAEAATPADASGPPDAGQAGPGTADAGIDAVAARVTDAMAPLIDKGVVNVRRTEQWLEIEFKTSILFDSGQARLASDALPVLGELATQLRGLPHSIEVEGFTDNVPIHTAAYPSNWELSAARAASVVHLFMKNGLTPERMAAVGYGEYRPIADNTTAQGRGRNRRVVVVISAAQDERRLRDLRETATPGGATGNARAPASADEDAS